jgi:hypothetical protein
MKSDPASRLVLSQSERAEWLGGEGALEIRILHRHGKGIREIARETGSSRNTVRRYLRDESAARYKPRPLRATKLDPSASRPARPRSGCRGPSNQMRLALPYCRSIRARKSRKDRSRFPGSTSLRGCLPRCSPHPPHRGRADARCTVSYGAAIAAPNRSSIYVVARIHRGRRSVLSW